jgi:hypothetical protein
MSILIKGIDLPKRDEYIPMRIYGNGHIWINGAYKGVAIQIPTPHGRLIDVDKVVKEYYKKPTYPSLCAILNNAPTILEAER